MVREGRKEGYGSLSLSVDSIDRKSEHAKSMPNAQRSGDRIRKRESSFATSELGAERTRDCVGPSLDNR